MEVSCSGKLSLDVMTTWRLSFCYVIVMQVPQLTMLAAALFPWPVLRGLVEAAVAAAKQSLLSKVGVILAVILAVILGGSCLASRLLDSLGIEPFISLGKRNG